MVESGGVTKSMALLSMMVGHQVCSFSIVLGVELSYQSQNEDDESSHPPKGALKIRVHARLSYFRSATTCFLLNSAPHVSPSFFNVEIYFPRVMDSPSRRRIHG